MTVAVDPAVSFAGFASVTPLAVAVALLLTVPLAVGLTAYVAVNDVLVPELSVKIVHGNPVLHGAVAETIVRLALGVSLTVTLATFDGPLFVTVKLYVMV